MKTNIFLGLIAFAMLSCSKTGDSIDKTDDQSSNFVNLVFKEEKAAVIKGFHGHYITYPSNYATNPEPLPLLIYLHGMGQKGKGNGELKLLGEDGLGKLMKENKLPLYFKGAGGKEFSFITISPQWSDKPDAEGINQIIKYINDQFKLDKSRIYISGISAGSMALSEIIFAEGNKIAAFVPIAGVAKDSDGKLAKASAEHNIPVWAFHNSEDTVVPYSWTDSYVLNINNHQPKVKAKLTRFNDNDHDAWTRALDPAFKQDGKSIYEWLLQYSKS